VDLHDFGVDAHAEDGHVELDDEHFDQFLPVGALVVDHDHGPFSLHVDRVLVVLEQELGLFIGDVDCTVLLLHLQRENELLDVAAHDLLVFEDAFEVRVAELDFVFLVHDQCGFAALRKLLHVLVALYDLLRLNHHFLVVNVTAQHVVDAVVRSHQLLEGLYGQFHLERVLLGERVVFVLDLALGEQFVDGGLVVVVTQDFVFGAVDAGVVLEAEYFVDAEFALDLHELVLSVDEAVGDELEVGGDGVYVLHDHVALEDHSLFDDGDVLHAHFGEQVELRDELGEQLLLQLVEKVLAQLGLQFVDLAHVLLRLLHLHVLVYHLYQVLREVRVIHQVVDDAQFAVELFAVDEHQLQV